MTRRSIVHFGMLLTILLTPTGCQRIVVERWMPTLATDVRKSGGNIDVAASIQPGMSKSEVLSKLAGRLRPSGPHAYRVLNQAGGEDPVRTTLYFHEDELKAIIQSGTYYLPMLF